MTKEIGEKMVLRKQAKVDEVEKEKMQAMIRAVKEKLRYCPKKVTYH